MKGRSLSRETKRININSAVMALGCVGKSFISSRCRRHATTMTTYSSITPTVGSVLTFLSPSPAYSRSAIEFLDRLFQLPITPHSSSTASRKDRLDELHFGSSPSSSCWDSVACACPTSGTMLHFLSFSSALDNKENESSIDNNYVTSNSPLHLIAVHGSTTSRIIHHDALIECRRRLANAFHDSQGFSHEARLRGLCTNITRRMTGKRPNINMILGSKISSGNLTLDLTPIFSINEEEESTSEYDNQEQINHCSGKLRELVLPYFPETSSIQTKMSMSSLLSRPRPGIYQANHGLIFRPLPAAREDLHLSSPSLVFQCKSLDEMRELVEDKLGGETYKIGWCGHGQLGSLIVSHPSLMGLEIRLCESTSEEWVPSIHFDESQQSLLAGSLPELQSTHVVSQGDKMTTSGDSKIGKGDCWVEVRSNVKRPSGFLKKLPESNRIAKIPDLPYE